MMKSVIAVGAQTERRGDAWPVRGLLGGKDLAGRFTLSGHNSRRRLTDDAVGVIHAVHQHARAFGHLVQAATRFEEPTSHET
jgi:hypothetical protein